MSCVTRGVGAAAWRVTVGWSVVELLLTLPAWGQVLIGGRMVLDEGQTPTGARNASAVMESTRV